MKKKKLSYVLMTLASVVMLMLASAMFVYSANSQSAISTFTVTYTADNVAFTASAYYQREGESSTTALKDSSNTSSSTISFLAGDNNASSKTLAAQGDIEMGVSMQYVLFTYVFHNDATAGGYDIKVSLADGTSDKDNVTITYLASANTYTTTSAGLDEHKDTVTGATAPTNVYIPAQGTKYFYILVTINNAFKNSNYNSTPTAGLVWTVTSTTAINHVDNAVVSFASSTVNKSPSDESFRIALTNGGDATPVYTSSDTSVATVDSTGLVTIVGSGTTTITATVADTANTDYSTTVATYTLTVANPSYTVTFSGNYNYMDPEVYYQIGESVVDAPTTSSSALTPNWPSILSGPTLSISQGEKLFLALGGRLMGMSLSSAIFYIGNDASGDSAGTLSYSQGNRISPFYIEIEITENSNIYVVR